MAGAATLISMTTVPTGRGCPHWVVRLEEGVCVGDTVIHLADTCQDPADPHTHTGFNDSAKGSDLLSRDRNHQPRSKTSKLKELCAVIS